MIFAGENSSSMSSRPSISVKFEQNLSALLNGGLGCVTGTLYDVSEDQRRQLRE